MKFKFLIFLFSTFLISYMPLYAQEDHQDEHKEEHGHDQDDHSDHDEGETVHLEKKSQDIVGFKIIQVKNAALFSIIEVVGDIAQDTENVKHITPPQAGMLKSLKVKVGDVVEKGTPLGELLDRLGQEIELVSPSHGIVMARYAKENEAVDTVSSILTIADPDLLRASFNVYEKDLAGIKPGLSVVVNSMAYPHKDFEGEIVFVSPQIDPKTRAIRVRAHIKNEEHLLKFGMFVSGKIKIPVSSNTLSLPEEAIQNVKEKTVVFVPITDNKFQMREVTIGRRTEGSVEVLSGLEENENVVGQGSFYLKSELLKGELGHGHAH